MTVILILAAAAGAAFLASVIMSRAANRPAIWNMGLGGALAVVVLVCGCADRVQRSRGRCCQPVPWPAPFAIRRKP